MNQLLDYGISYGPRIGIKNGYLCITSQDEERVQFVEFTPEVERRIKLMTKRHPKSSIERYTAFFDIVSDETSDEWKTIHSPAWWMDAFIENIEFHYSPNELKHITSSFDNFLQDWAQYYDSVAEGNRENNEHTPLDRTPSNEQMMQLWTDFIAQEAD